MFYTVSSLSAINPEWGPQYWTGPRDGWSTNPMEAQRYRTAVAARAAAQRISILEDRASTVVPVYPCGVPGAPLDCVA
jgi:hypothetical protein